MKFTILTIFPEIFESFLGCSLIHKGVEDRVLDVELINIRDYVTDSKHRQVDDEIYGGGAGMLIKAQPIIDILKEKFVLRRDESLERPENVKIILVGPSETVFDQRMAHVCVDTYDEVVFICGRYEGIDERVRLWCERKFLRVEHTEQTFTPEAPLSPCQETPSDSSSRIDFEVMSLGEFVTLGGEVPSMVMMEAIGRLVPSVIKEELSWQDESYAVAKGMQNLEYPQYTRPKVVEGMEVPEVLLSGHHEEIRKWREGEERRIEK